jgi:hypothetical protein
VAALSNTTVLPSAEIAGWRESALPATPAWVWLTRVVWPVARSCTKTWKTLAGPPGASSAEVLMNATNRPSAEMDGNSALPVPSAPVDDTLARVVAPVTRSRTKTSGRKLVSPPTRFDALPSKATNRPSAETDGYVEWKLPCTPPDETLSRDVLCEWTDPARADVAANAVASAGHASLGMSLLGPRGYARRRMRPARNSTDSSPRTASKPRTLP